jgi:FkbM family methyltransferase
VKLRQSIPAERMKEWIRLLESRYTPVRRALTIDGHRLKVVRSIWWDDTPPAVFIQEIEPYWQVLSGRHFGVILDVGAATGQFTLSACVRMPEASIVAFEPSPRQRALLARNVNMNGLGSRVRIESLALWNREDDMVFRTNGAISALRETGGPLTGLPFIEKVHAQPLDVWIRGVSIGCVDLIKMDIEGAEIEALEGARALLQRDRPELLVQAYHVRYGERTFGPCCALLNDQGYTCREVGHGSGLLHAVPTERMDPGVGTTQASAVRATSS